MTIYGPSPILGSDNRYHYVYRITNLVEQKHYYGSRSCKINPFDDLGTKYFSSASSYLNSWIKNDQKQNPNNYKYKILKTFYTRKNAIEFECLLHTKFNVGNSFIFYNQTIQTSTKFDTTGKTAAIDKYGNILLVSVNDSRLLSKELVGVNKGKNKSGNKGKISVIDKNGNTFRVDKDDPMYLSEDLVSIFKGKTVVRDSLDNTFLIDINDEKYISKEIKHMNFGHNNSKFEYYKITPWGIFESPSELEPEISASTLQRMCKNSDTKKLSRNLYTRCEKIRNTFGLECIGKLLNELGFGTMTKEEYQLLFSQKSHS